VRGQEHHAHQRETDDGRRTHRRGELDAETERPFKGRRSKSSPLRFSRNCKPSRVDLWVQGAIERRDTRKTPMKPLHLLGIFASLTLFACTGGSFTIEASDDPGQGEQQPVPSSASSSAEVVASQKGRAAPSKTDGFCVKNACGGCLDLQYAPGTSCGVCGSGHFVCDGSDAVRCDDPITTPATGSACGSCGTLLTLCSADNLSTYCPGDDTNACGGCGPLTGMPGEACGSSGVLRCGADRASVTCEDEKRELCATADRSEIVDASSASIGGATPDYFDDVRTIAIGHSMRHVGSIAKVTLSMSRQDWVGDGPEGMLILKLFQGVPGAPGVAELASATHIPDVPLGDWKAITFTFAVPTLTLAKGTLVYFQLSSDRPRFRYWVRGESAAAPAFPFFVRKGPGAFWAVDTGDFQPRIEVDALGCR
jgi:hypothetical protein